MQQAGGPHLAERPPQRPRSRMSLKTWVPRKVSLAPSLQRLRKAATVTGATSSNSSITTRPAVGREEGGSR